MVPDTVFFSFFISAILGAKNGWNVLMLSILRCSDFTGIPFAFLRQFRELAWMGVGLRCLALSGWQSVAIQEGSTRDPDNGS